MSLTGLYFRLGSVRVLPKGGLVRAKTRILSFVFLLLAPFAALHATGSPACGEDDLTFGCTKTAESGRLRAGCAVHSGPRFFASEWRIFDLQSEEVLKRVPTDKDGIALLEIPDRHWLILEGEIVCTTAGGELSIPYRFLVERTGKGSFRQRAYTPESLVATENWNPDTQLHYGAFRGRSLAGSTSSPAPGR
jgi:hypothetical protein